MTVFYDGFDYATDNAFLVEGGWTTLLAGGTLGNNFGSAAASSLMWGNPTAAGNTQAGLEYNHTTSLGNAGDTISMDANVFRGGGSTYTMSIILWDGADAGTRNVVATNTDDPGGGIGPLQALQTVSYTALPGDVGKEIIFVYEHSQNWGETADVTFDVTPVPEPSSTALLGLGGLALILRRRK